MDEQKSNLEPVEISDIVDTKDKIVYNIEKDFYKGMSGELRFKAEGLFKKAKEKGISIEDINMLKMKENTVEFPGIGEMELPAYIVKVRGRNMETGQMVLDGKQIDYYNRYQKYMAEKIERKNVLRDEKGRKLRDNGKAKLKEDVDFYLTEWERFHIGKDLIDDKEFGLEKTITGACDRVIRKLMGENDWLSPEESRLLDEEFENVEKKIETEKNTRKSLAPLTQRKATERQVNYLKAKIKNSGMDPGNDFVMKEILKQTGFGNKRMNDLNTLEMSRIIDKVSEVLPMIKDMVDKGGVMPEEGFTGYTGSRQNYKQ